MRLRSTFQMIGCTTIFVHFWLSCILELLFGDILVYTSHRMISRPCARFINGDNWLLRELQGSGVQEHHVMSLDSKHTFVKVPVNPKK